VGTKRRGNPKFGRLKHVPGTDTLKTNLRTWAHQIQQAGYRTATIGKWHLSKDPLPYGFDVNVAGSHSGSPPKGYFPPHPGAPGLDDAATVDKIMEAARA
jgi:arylsulfatase A-like enzyme